MSDTRVYFIGSTRSRAVKIGTANDPRHRMMSMQVGNAQRLVLLGEVPGDERYEKALHRSFAEYRIRGEWFRNEGRLADLLRLLPQMTEECPEPQPRVRRRAREDVVLASRERAKAQWATHLPVVRKHVMRIGYDRFSEMVRVRPSDLVRSLHPGRGRHFQVKWLMTLAAVSTEEEAAELMAPFIEASKQ